MIIFIFSFLKKISLSHLWCPTHQKSDFVGKVNFEFFYLMCKSLFTALKWHLIYQNWLRHTNSNIKKNNKCLLFSLFSERFLSISKKAHSCKIPLLMCCIGYGFSKKMYSKGKNKPRISQRFWEYIAKFQLFHTKSAKQ